MNTATATDLTVRAYSDPEEPGEPGLRVAGPEWAVRALCEALPGALDYDLLRTYPEHNDATPRETRVWAAARGWGSAEALLAAVRAAAVEAGLSVEVAS